ncbi:MAG: S-methyl-5-thioribose-1-phosphate isomerase [Spirochaetia bacterium]|nr:S-methyl-5-thioribose-1-phosphate isomerase [Spirochaetia bacterium]
MKYKAFWLNDSDELEVIDQTLLPHEKKIHLIRTPEEAADSIKKMIVRGAGTIGSVAAFGIYLSAKSHSGDYESVLKDSDMIRKARPTAVNLEWAVNRMMQSLEGLSGNDLIKKARSESIAISDEDVKRTEEIGRLGCGIIKDIMKKKNINKINVLTHCNAGWLGIADSGTALAPVYEAKKQGIDIHVWVDETRPRNQGALTSFELSENGVSHTYIADNAGGHLMQRGEVDLVLVGADRVTGNGDTANKIGTYLKAAAAKDNDVPFYVLIPVSTFDFKMKTGFEIPIEERNEDEVLFVQGLDENNEIHKLRIPPVTTHAKNPAFDVTPARLITGIITEEGVVDADEKSISEKFKYPAGSQ